MKSFTITQTITERQDPTLVIYFKDINKYPILSAGEEKEIGKRIKEGDKKAINKLVCSNLRFAVSVAKYYQNKGLPLVDLIQSANEGLLEAAKRWDVDRGIKFISYAVWWIRQAIMLSLSGESRAIRLPMNQIIAFNKVTKATESFIKENHRDPSSEELASKVDFNRRKINSTLEASNRVLSLDLSYDDENTLLDMVPNDNISPDSNLEYSYLQNAIVEIIKELPDRLSDIVRMSFGIQTEALNLEEIGCRFGLGAERVRQLLNKALVFLKKNNYDDLKKLL